MPTDSYKFALQPGSYDLDELKTMRYLVQRVQQRKGNIYVRITDTDKDTRFETHSGELKVKANGWGPDIIPIYIQVVNGRHLLDRPRNTNRAGGWYRFPLDEPDVCRIADYDFDQYAIDNGEDIVPRHNYMVLISWGE